MFLLRLILILSLVPLFELGNESLCQPATQPLWEGDSACDELPAGHYSALEGLQQATMGLPQAFRLPTPESQQVRTLRRVVDEVKQLPLSCGSKSEGSWLSAIGSCHILSFFADETPARRRLLLHRLRI